MRRPASPPLALRVLDLLKGHRSPMTVRDMVYEFGIDGPCDATVGLVLRELVVSGAVVRQQTGRKSTYRVKREGE